LSGSAIRYASISELRGALRRREVSAEQLATDALELLDTVGRELNAVAELSPDRAMREARAADEALGAGNEGSLTGIPWGAKDLLATAGIPTRWGAPPFRDQVFSEDATVVRRITAAGGVLVAKLAMIEMAGAGLYRWADAGLNGPCRNPWDQTRWSGGSSSGSAAAVAAGLLPFAIGSETGGSLVIPASFCGLTALRPSAGTVSRHGALIVGWSLDKLGPLAHSAAECSTILAAIAGWDDLDAGTVDFRFRPVRRRRFRLGVLRQRSADPAVNDAFDRAIEALEGLDLVAREVSLPDIDLRDLHDRLVAGETAAEHEAFIRGPRLGALIDDAQKAAMTEYLTRSPASYPQAVVERAAASRAIDRIFDDVDALVAPTVLTEAVGLDEDLLGYRHGRRGGNMFLGSVAGLPELTCPMGFGSNGLPVGISIIAHRGGDATALRIGELYQRVTSWHEQHPPPDQPPTG
jgi:aspartyl-tRNA(Asn)/glutamyl-tRNA(Gln) amidotransferase subunit A